MNNLKPAKQDKDSLFSQNIPMRRSVIVPQNVLFMDLSMSASTIRTTQRNKIQRFQNPRGSAIINNITYPGPNFLAKKLKRILQSHLRTIFAKIRTHRKKIINLDLLSSKSKRFLSSAFLSIRFYARSHKSSALQQTISRNRRPHLIYQSVARVVRRNQKQAIQNILNSAKRQKYVTQFAIKLTTLFKNSTKQYTKKQLIKNIKFLHYTNKQKLQSARMFTIILPSIILNLKSQSFKKISYSLILQKYNNISEAKKQAMYKLNQSTSDKARMLVKQRQQIRKIKYNLDNFSNDRTKARYQIRRDMNTQRIKIKQQEKKAKAVIAQMQKQTAQLQQQLSKLNSVNKDRLSRIQNPINIQTVQNLYTQIWSQQPDKLGEIKLKRQIKQQIPSFQQQLQKLDEYHIFQNQKLRQQVFQYQNIQVFKSRWPQQELIVQQNKTLKEIIQCIVCRALDNVVYEGRIRQIGG